MKLTLTVWTAAADADGGTQGASFATEREAEDWVLEQMETGAQTREALDAWLAENPENDFWRFVEGHKANGDLDTFNIECCDIEFDIPAQPVRVFDIPAQPVRVVVGIEGGIVQGASANHPVEVCVIDYDADDDDLFEVPQSDGKPVQATGHITDAHIDPADVDQVFAAVRAHWGEDGKPEVDLTCGQCEGTGTIRGGLGGDEPDEECPVCNGTGKIDCDPDQWPGGDITGHPGYKAAPQHDANAVIDRHQRTIDAIGFAAALKTALGDGSMTTDYPPCQDIATLGGATGPISQHRQELMKIAGQKMRLDQAIADAPLAQFGPHRPIFEGITSIIGDLLLTLQIEAIRKDIR